MGIIFSDGDCRDDQRCFIPPDQTHGACGAPQRDCIYTGDCQAGSVCVAVDVNGKRTCVESHDGSPCNDDEHCPGGHCAFPDDIGVGLCTDGTLKARCVTTADCNKGLRCGGSLCSDGAYGSSCNTDDDGASHQCRGESCEEGRDQDYCDSDSDCSSGICIYDVRCSAGNIDDACEFDSDCSSGICASVCTDGAARLSMSGGRRLPQRLSLRL